MNASNLSNLNTTITHLGVVLEGFKESMMYTSASQRFQEQVQKLQINHVNNELDKTRESLTSLRLRLVHTDASLDAALTAAEQMDERARRTAFANEALMNNFQKQNTLADKRMETAQNKKAAAHAMMNIAQEKMADANEMMKIAQKMNADADERFKVAQAKIDAAVGLQDQADVALVTLEQNIARGDEHSTEVVETLRQVFELQKLQKIKMEAEVAKQLETKEFEVRMMKRWNEVREAWYRRGECG